MVNKCAKNSHIFPFISDGFDLLNIKRTDIFHKVVPGHEARPYTNVLMFLF